MPRHSDRRSRDHTAPVSENDQLAVPVVEEQLSLGKRKRETGRVKVTKSVSERTETVRVPVTSERVEVKHVPVGRPVEEVPEVRQEADVTIIPVTEEVVVVTKQLVLKEEIHLVHREDQHDAIEDVTLKSETVEVTRQESEEPKTE